MTKKRAKKLTIDQVASMGGKQSAKNMTRAQRVARAKKAAKARHSKKN